MATRKRIPDLVTPPHMDNANSPERGEFRDTQSLELPFEQVLLSPDRKAELLRKREKAVHGTEKERTHFLLNELYVYTPDVKHVLGVAQQFLSFAGMFPNPGGMRVVANSGMGKDALLRCLLNMYPSEPRSDAPRYPLLYVTFRERLAPGVILKSLLAQMHCVYNDRQSVPELEANLIAAMQACGTLGIVFNEAQHMLSAAKGTQRTQARIAGEAGDWLKGFLDRIERPAIFFGVPGWDEVFDLDAQLGSRIPYRYVISPFAFDSTFIGILKVLDEGLPMPEPAGLAEKNLAQSLHQVTHGVWRPLIHLLRDAIVFATRRKSPRLEYSDLFWACQLQRSRQGEALLG